MRLFTQLTTTGLILCLNFCQAWSADDQTSNPNAPVTAPVNATATTPGSNLTQPARDRLNNLLREREKANLMKAAGANAKQPPVQATAQPTGQPAGQQPANKPATPPAANQPVVTQTAGQSKDNAESLTPVRSVRSKAATEGDVAPWSTSHDTQARNDEYEKVIGNYKGAISEQRLIQIVPDKVTFANLARNFVNHIRCEGEIQAVIIPQDRGMEFKLLANKHDLYVLVGDTPYTQFPLDLSLQCDGKSFIINGLVTPRVVSQEIELLLPKKGDLSVGELDKWKDAITKSAALPLEEQVTRITQRVFKGDSLGYWRDIDISAAKSRWVYDHYSVLLQKAIDTNINGLQAWDFVFRGQMQRQDAYNEIRKVVRGEVVAFGTYEYEGKNMMRIIVITKKNT